MWDGNNKGETVNYYLGWVLIEPLWDGNAFYFANILKKVLSFNRIIVGWKCLTAALDNGRPVVLIEPLWDGNELKENDEKSA
ncbi:hypothetical protein ciss_01970 [Carboxydothermus islandicus]|uniref:Uncharacterized protein n=1 Tax=Carboxydothermus islandicus TaxID=661089 RepID=A0A1L8CZG9_9THEO|nr:hypothetical protein ciss_01970 [Carboxydothermus islandicus]